jgi:hypothetical protein
MNLDQTQELFHRILTGAAPVSREEIEACFLPSRELSAAERARIYADMYVWRQVDALRQDFGQLARVLGDGEFYALCEGYVRAHPSEHHDLGKLGRRLAEFVRSHPGARSDLGDLAELEWARAEVFFEAPAAPVTRAALAALGPGAFVGARLKLVPALRLLRLEHDVLHLWRRLEGGLPPEAPIAAPVAVAVWRPAFDVFHTALAPDEAVALERAMAGATLGEVCAAFEAREAPAQAAFAALASWLDEGWVAEIDVSTPAARSDP